MWLVEAFGTFSLIERTLLSLLCLSLVLQFWTTLRVVGLRGNGVSRRELRGLHQALVTMALTMQQGARSSPGSGSIGTILSTPTNSHPSQWEWNRRQQLLNRQRPFSSQNDVPSSAARSQHWQPQPLSAEELQQLQARDELPPVASLK